MNYNLSIVVCFQSGADHTAIIIYHLSLLLFITIIHCYYSLLIFIIIFINIFNTIIIIFSLFFLYFSFIFSVPFPLSKPWSFRSVNSLKWKIRPVHLPYVGQFWCSQTKNYAEYECRNERTPVRKGAFLLAQLQSTSFVYMIFSGTRGQFYHVPSWVRKSGFLGIPALIYRG